MHLQPTQDFTEFATARWARLVRLAVLMGCTPSDAEDLVQTTLEKCFLKWAKVAEARDQDAYLYRILTNTLKSARRRRWRNEIPQDEPPGQVQADETERVDDVDALIRALARLHPDQRAAVVLRFYGHLNEEQMADALGVPRGTVKSRLSRGLANLAADPSLRALKGLNVDQSA